MSKFNTLSIISLFLALFASANLTANTASTPEITSENSQELLTPASDTLNLSEGSSDNYYWGWRYWGYPYYRFFRPYAYGYAYGYPYYRAYYGYPYYGGYYGGRPYYVKKTVHIKKKK